MRHRSRSGKTASPRATCWRRSRGASAPDAVNQPAAAVQVRRTAADDAAREERVKMTRLRQTIARRLGGQNTAATLTTYEVE